MIGCPGEGLYPKPPRSLVEQAILTASRRVGAATSQSVAEASPLPLELARCVECQFADHRLSGKLRDRGVSSEYRYEPVVGSKSRTQRFR